MYLILAMLRNAIKVAAMLLYAKMEEDIQLGNVCQIHENQIMVRTLDLNLPFMDIAKQSSAIAKTHLEIE